jgi:hypothetical protein
MAKISTKVVDELKQQIDAVTGHPEGIPGTVYCAVNKNGELIFQHASGVIGKGKQEKMTMDTVFWIASCTKMVTGIACMQLVEQGKLALDDGDLVEKVAPVSRPGGKIGNGKGRPYFYFSELIACSEPSSRGKRQDVTNPRAAGTCKGSGH